MKKIILFLFVLTSISFSQTLLLEENFNYTAGTNLTDNGWTAHSGSGTNPITVNSGGLTFSGYSSSGIGNAALVNNTGEDDNKSLSATVNSGTIYYSFLVRVDAVADGYFIHLNKNVTTFAARVFIKSATGGFNFGLSNTNTGAFGTTVYSTGTTYLCIVKYDVSTVGACSLWVKTEEQGVPSSEIVAGSPEITNTGTGQVDIIAIALRQYSSSQNIIVDGIRVSDSWSQAPLPVELTSFNAMQVKGGVKLNWSTATETNNYGFEIERNIVGTKLALSEKGWEKVGFVQGHGNSNSPKDYTFVDVNPPSGKVQYKLKQIDFDGTFEYSNIVEVNVDTPQNFILEQNYPNPFNPTTTIKYTIPAVILSQPDLQAGSSNGDNLVTLKIYDVLGNEVATLVNEYQKPGTYSIEFRTQNFNLSSGVYFYKLQVGEYSQTKKLIIMK